MGMDDIILREYYAREDAREKRWDEIEESLRSQHKDLGSPERFVLRCNGKVNAAFTDVDKAVEVAGNSDENDTWTIEEE